MTDEFLALVNETISKIEKRRDQYVQKMKDILMKSDGQNEVCKESIRIYCKRSKEEKGFVEDGCLIISKPNVVTTAAPATTLPPNVIKKVVKVEITPEAIDPDDLDELSDLITAAMNMALQASLTYSKAEMKKITGGLQLPGLF